MSDDLSFWDNLRHGYFTRFKARYAADYELYTYASDSATIKVELSGSRRLLRLELYIHDINNVELDRVECTDDSGDLTTPKVATTVAAHDGIKVFHIVLRDTPKSATLAIKLKDHPDPFDYQVRVLIVNDRHEDFELLRTAMNNLESQQYRLAVGLLKDYLELNMANPHAHRMMAFSYLQLKKRDDALEASLQAMGRGLAQDSIGLFRVAKGKEPAMPVSEIRALQSQSHDWRLPGQVGLVVIDRAQRYSLGYGNCYYCATSAIMEIRRPAAGRMLRTLSFPLSYRSELLLHTTLRVIHGDDKVEEMPQERFRITDAENSNLFIAMEDDKEGHWILPDLETGDIIVWSYDILGKCFATEDGNQFFKLMHPFDANIPTWRGRIKLSTPIDVKLNLTRKSWSDRFTIEHEETDLETVIRLSGDMVAPVRHTGFSYEGNYLNPLVAASSGDRSWADVAAFITDRSFGGANPEDALPSQLAEIIGAGGDRLRMLETAFYWIRDRLKYASLKSAHDYIGTTGRAARIVESGTADCKDRAYLMRLVCRELGFPCQYVLVSSKAGLVVAELPADQFDHVFVRVETDKGWVYLDPTSTESAFDTTPYWCQGLHALVLDGDGRLELIPEDAPGQNVLELHESIEDVRNGWLEGSFDTVARGHIGRSLNEVFKSLSLAIDDPHRAATESLRRYLPASVATEYERISDTASSTLFHIAGRMRRCRLLPLLGGELIGTLTWQLPFLPVSFWRVLNLEKMFVFNFPCKVRLAVTFGPRITNRLKDHSVVAPHTCDIGEVTQSVETRDGLLTLARHIQINRRFVTDEFSAQLPQLLDRIESALRLAVSLEA